MTVDANATDFPSARLIVSEWIGWSEVGCVQRLLMQCHVHHRGAFKNVAELKAAIADYLERHNANPKPFVWTKSAAEVLEKVARAKQASESQHQQQRCSEATSASPESA